MGYGCTMVFSALGGAGSNYLQDAGVYIQRPLSEGASCLPRRHGAAQTLSGAATRYSEDIDLVQVNAEPIKETMDHLREALSWLGEPVVKQKKHNNTLVFRVQPTDLGAGEIHLKVEINCKEHFSVFPMVRVPFSVENDWFSGRCEVVTYELDELVGTKVRTLYQRLKGRDLFDVYTALITDKLNLDRVMTAYDRYLRFVASHAPTYEEFVLNMDEKMHNPEFLGDTTDLLRPGLTFDPQPAWEKVREEIVSCLIN